MGDVAEPKPVRIQRSRKRGAKLASPNGLPVVCVTRPGLFGNPFTGPRAVEMYRDYLRGGRCFHIGGETGMAYVPAWHHRDDVLKALPKLRGCNLACFCKPGDACHADVLLELANAAASAGAEREERR